MDIRRAVVAAAVIAAAGCGDGGRSVGTSPTAIAQSSSEVTQARPSTSLDVLLTKGTIAQVPTGGSIDVEGTREFSLVGGFDSSWGGLLVCSESPTACAP